MWTGLFILKLKHAYIRNKENINISCSRKEQKIDSIEITALPKMLINTNNCSTYTTYQSPKSNKVLVSILGQRKMPLCLKLSWTSGIMQAIENNTFSTNFQIIWKVCGLLYKSQSVIYQKSRWTTPNWNTISWVSSAMAKLHIYPTQGNTWLNSVLCALSTLTV